MRQQDQIARFDEQAEVSQSIMQLLPCCLRTCQVAFALAMGLRTCQGCLRSFHVGDDRDSRNVKDEMIQQKFPNPHGKEKCIAEQAVAAVAHHQEWLSTPMPKSCLFPNRADARMKAEAEDTEEDLNEVV